VSRTTTLPPPLFPIDPNMADNDNNPFSPLTPDMVNAAMAQVTGNIIPVRPTVRQRLEEKKVEQDFWGALRSAEAVQGCITAPELGALGLAFNKLPQDPDLRLKAAVRVMNMRGIVIAGVDVCFPPISFPTPEGMMTLRNRGRRDNLLYWNPLGEGKVLMEAFVLDPRGARSYRAVGEGISDFVSLAQVVQALGWKGTDTLNHLRLQPRLGLTKRFAMGHHRHDAGISDLDLEQQMTALHHTLSIPLMGAIEPFTEKSKRGDKPGWKLKDLNIIQPMFWNLG
jgi:hypothetical protein